ncbi:copper chaperone PCu(A)C [Cognaticolwellia beringensis]|uniref:Copper chaperone PCu(A)C n=1 Tax=Cognaticolwellia beringensis TaxID=1967665 RepID=A0A222G8D5_9GAMM|nr:copper chaperone PCu(A)C [Cognaticolwellia beringensis]ASP48139.1 copper chaperone PCu(A)C [Cognaticolwellia beringensis]
MRNVFLPITSLIILVSSVFANAGYASDNTEILVENGYVRESIPGTSISSAYMTIKNLSAKNIRLIAASSVVSERIEIHQHTMVDGLMRMRQQDYAEVSAHNITEFQPSGYHLMIFDLKHPIKAKENIIITLHFDDQSRIDVNYTVQGLKQKKHHH